MQIPLLSGITATEQADFALSYPVNLEPVPTDTGLSKGYLRSTSGANQVLTGPGQDRGGILWNNGHYRVMGTSLVHISGTSAMSVGNIPGSQPVALDYGFGRLIIQTDGNLYYYDGTSITQVTDPDLGTSLDAVWMDGYTVSTDGTNVVVTDLANPTSVNPLRYGSAEADPDGITGLLRIRDELVVLGQNTIEFFSNAGGSGFPFEVQDGATIPIGCVGRKAKCLFSQSAAFVGSGRNKALGVWLIGSGTADKLSNRFIDDELAKVADPTSIICEERSDRDEQRLLIHLPNKTLVFLYRASQASQEKVWYVAASGIAMDQAYRMRSPVLVGNDWYVGDTQSSAIGVMTDGPGTSDLPPAFMSMTFDGETYTMERACQMPSIGSRMPRVRWAPHRRFKEWMGLRFRGQTGLPHFGEAAGWQFATQLIYNQAKGGILHSAELTGLAGRGSQGFAALEADVEPLSA